MDRSPVRNLAFALCLLLPVAALAEEGRLLRMPDIHGDRVVFVYAGDLWTVSRSGGVAGRLTTFEGLEVFPKFSPDGEWIAFSGEYDGNMDVFVIPSTGGEPRRLTYHPGSDQVLEWSPDGKSVVFRSARDNPTTRYNRTYLVSLEGGWPKPLELPICERVSFDPRNEDRVAFTELNTEFRTWKRYKGGMAEDLWIYDFGKQESKQITDWEGNENFPMWIGETIYFSSSHEKGKENLYSYDVGTEAIARVTDFTEYDVKWPSQGDGAIVFENGGYLYVLDVPSGKPEKISVEIHTDGVLARPTLVKLADLIGGASVSPSAKRVVFEARGELFTVPAEKGDPRRLTETPGAYERDPAWSPDGKWIATLSDATGEYELYIVPQDGKGEPRQLTKGTASFKFNPTWSPDSKKIVYADKDWSIVLVDVESGKRTSVDRGTVDEITQFAWSPRSDWIAYVKQDDNYYGAIWLYSLDSGDHHRVTDGLNPDFSPSFDPEGNYLYFLSNRHFNPVFNSFAFEYALSRATGIYAIALRKDTPHPFPPQSDEEEPKKEGDDKKDDDEDKKDKDDKKEKEEPLKIDLEGLALRIAEVPVTPGNYDQLTASKGKIYFVEEGEGGGDDDDDDDEDEGGSGGALKFFDVEEREVKQVVSGVQGYELTPDGEKVLFAGGGGAFTIVEAKEDAKTDDGKLKTGALEMTVDFRAEWKQMFADAWRLERDFFYDPGLHGIDWDAMRNRYEPLVAHVRHRADLNYLIGELIGELTASHAYVGGGDLPDVAKVNVGLLGADYVVDSGRYRFEKVYRQSNWDQDVIAPLGQPGIQVEEGDYLLAVNGKEVTSEEDLHAAFQNTAGKQTVIAVADSPKGDRKEFTVVPASSETDLRYEDWVEGNRKKVYEATGGRVGYIHMPNTAFGGVKRFSRDFYNQVDKDGMILDGRYNSGGFIPDYVIDRLGRTMLGYWSRREGRSFRTPDAMIEGPKVCVTNSWAGSGGDCIPFFFRKAGLGPIVGTRTWGGLVGISRGIRLMDGGSVTMPDFGFYTPGESWEVENRGVTPDFVVQNRPEDVLLGHDAQLEKAIELVMEALREHPAVKAKPPAYPVKRETGD